MRRVITPRKRRIRPRNQSKICLMSDAEFRLTGEMRTNRLGSEWMAIAHRNSEVLSRPARKCEGRGRQRPRPVDHVAVESEDRDVAEIGEQGRPILAIRDLDLFVVSELRMFTEFILRDEAGKLQREITSSASVSESSNCWSK